MNNIRQTQALNKRELEAGIPPSASWHVDYRDTAYVYVGGLSFDLSEGDVITIFSQFGEPVFINLVRDKETGKSKGFCFLKYEDQRSTDLAVDNLNGATLMGRVLRVDHTRYKKKEGESLEDNTMGQRAVVEAEETASESEEEQRRPMLKEERELAELMRQHDDDDPMKAYLVQQKKEEVAEALHKLEVQERRSDSKREKHRDRTKHRSREERSDRHRSDHSRRHEYRRSRSRSPRSDSEEEYRRRRRRRRERSRS